MPDQPALVPAGLGTRVGARITDGMVFAWLSFFVLIEVDARLLGGDPLGRRPHLVDARATRTVVIVGLLSMAYEVMPVLFRGATLGKAMLGLRVVDQETGQRPGPLAVLVRWLMIYGVAAIPLVGWVLTLMVLFPVLVLKSGRGIHDRMAGTRVVKRAMGP